MSLKLSITRAAAEFGVSRETILRGLTQGGIKTGPGKTHSLREFLRALGGDLKFARTREATLRGDALELDNEARKGALFDRPIVEAMVAAHAGLVRQALLQARAELPARCNPSNPKVALVAVDHWLGRFWPKIRADVAALAGPPSETPTAQAASTPEAQP